jgi:hypothetical protein
MEDPVPHQLRDLGVGLGGHLAGDDDEAGGHERLHGHPAARVVCEERVEDGVADLVSDLVRVPLGHRLRGEKSSSHWSTPTRVTGVGMTLHMDFGRLEQ